MNLKQLLFISFQLITFICHYYLLNVVRCQKFTVFETRDLFNSKNVNPLLILKCDVVYGRLIKFFSWDIFTIKIERNFRLRKRRFFANHLCDAQKCPTFICHQWEFYIYFFCIFCVFFLADSCKLVFFPPSLYCNAFFLYIYPRLCFI